MLNSQLTKIIASLILAVIGLLIYGFGALPLANILLLLLFTVGLYFIAENIITNRLLAVVCWLLVLAVGFIAATYRPGDFSYPLVWSFGSLYEGGNHYDLYANLSKALCGYLIVVWLLKTVDNKQSPGLVVSGVMSALAAVLLATVAVLVFGIELHPKWPAGIMYFIVINLAITVVAEEAFFRLLMQDYVQRLFKNSVTGKVLALLISATVFALAHTAGVTVAFWLYLLAGLLYAGVYLYTRRLSMAIGCHFLVNLLHFTVLEYPLSLP